MDFAGASRTLHAVDRLLAGAIVAALLAVLALTLAAGPARAQVQAPPDTAPGLSAPDQAADPDGWPDDWDGGGHPHGGGAMPGASGGVRPHAPDVGVQPPRAGETGEDDGRRPEDADEEEELPAVTSTYVAGKVARMRTDGRAAIPRGAPKRVRSLIAQYNRIVGKRYKWGGGHAKLVDSGYDCSGAVGYGLIKGGLLRTTMVSGSFARWGSAGAGRWVTIHAHRDHVYVEVAGLRLDTSAIGDRGGRSGVRWRPVIGQRRGFKVRHPTGL